MKSYIEIENLPAYRQLVSERNRLSAVLSIAMIVIYFGFIFLVAFDKPLLGQPIGNGVMTVGIPLGLLVIISAFILTGIYVVIANKKFDALNEEIVRESK